MTNYDHPVCVHFCLRARWIGFCRGICWHWGPVCGHSPSTWSKTTRFSWCDSKLCPWMWCHTSMFPIYVCQSLFMGGGMAYGGLPFPDIGCPVPGVYMYYVPDMITVWDHTVWIIQDGPPLYQIYMLNLGQSAGNWFSMRRLGPLMNHLPPVWRFPFGSLFSKITVGMYFGYSGEDFIYSYFCLCLILVCFYIT